MPKLHEETGGTETNIYCRATMSDTRPFSATDHQSWPKVGNQAKPLRYSEEKLHFIQI
jgi:hypothetical protein